MRRLFFCNRRILPADAKEKVRYIVDPRMDDEHSLGNRKGGDRLRKKKCYIYTRVSTMAQAEGYSLDAQQEKLRKYAEYKNLEIAREYCDAGKSGKSIKGRPAFQQMMEDVASQKDDVSCVLVFKLSRFGRNAADVLKSLQLLMDYEVDLVSVDDAIDSSTQGGRLTLAILSAVAEIERENITVQFLSGKMQKLKEGGWPGGPIPYGYRKEDDKLVQYPQEAEIVKQIFNLYLQDGMLATSIVRHLNDNGYTRLIKDKVSPFKYDFITTVLDNPFYCGKIFYGRRSNSKEPQKQKRDVLEIQGNHEPIISVEQWEQVQQKRKEHSGRCQKIDEPDRVSILSGLVKCPACGAGMIATKNKYVNKNRGSHYKTLHYYSCGNARKQNGMTCKFRHTYNQAKVDSAVLDMIGKLFTVPSFQKETSKWFQGKDSIEELTEQLKTVRKKLYHQEQQKRRLGEILDNLDILADDYDESYDKTQAEIDCVYDEIERLEMLLSQTKKKLESVEQGTKALKQVENLIQNIPKFFEEMTCEEKRDFYRLLIEKIEMYPEETPDGRIIKSISFKIPVFYEDWVPKKELIADEVITYTLDTSEVGITSAEAKATYVEIKKYILDRYGTKVSSLYIAQIKRKYGIDMGENYNKPDDPNKRVPKCPKAKEEMIIEALKHFKMLEPDVKMIA